MATSVVMPALEMAQETGKLVSWKKKEGEQVKKGEILLEVETDKAVVELEAAADGVLAGVTAKVDDVVPVGQTIAWLLKPGEAVPASSGAPQQTGRKMDSAPAAAAVAAVAEAPAAPVSVAGAKISPKARRLAREHGVPAAGGTAVFQTAPYWKARVLWKQQCVHCHAGDDRKAPLIGAGHGDRIWIKAFLQDPSGDAFYGRTKLGKTDKAMTKVEQTGRDLDALVEMVYAETGDGPVDGALVERGHAIFDETCTDCHTRTAGEVGDSAPNLSGHGTAAQLASFIADASAPAHFGAKNEMPKFDEELSEGDRKALAEWLVWLRKATPAEVAALGEP